MKQKKLLLPNAIKTIDSKTAFVESHRAALQIIILVSGIDLASNSEPAQPSQSEVVHVPAGRDG